MEFSAEFVAGLERLFAWRRDVRHFRRDPVPEDLLTRCIESMRLAPSVGLSEPWRIVRLRSEAARAACIANFEAANADALAGYDTERAGQYAALKLSGMREAPVSLAVFCDEGTCKGAGLGTQTMPEMRVYSVVSAIMLLWLSARAQGLGMGWVSILDPARLSRDLGVDPDWRFVACLCIGWPEEEAVTPELERVGWEARSPSLEVIER